MIWCDLGLPGSGKSTLAREIVASYEQTVRSVVLSTDDFFHVTPRPMVTEKQQPESNRTYIEVTNIPPASLIDFSEPNHAQIVKGDYVFDMRMIKHAHRWNQARTQYAMTKNIPVIVVDNTFVCRWEAKAYVLLAQQFGYTVRISTPQTEWWLKRDCAEMAQRNVHGVTEEKIRIMADKWEDIDSVEDILFSEEPFASHRRHRPRPYHSGNRHASERFTERH